LTWINPHPGDLLHHHTMMNDSAVQLARKCTTAVQGGKTFPTVWQTLLKGNGLLEGIPRQRLDQRMRPILAIPLITGQQLIFDGEAREFRLE
jgi:hypothetical protein